MKSSYSPQVVIGRFRQIWFTFSTIVKLVWKIQPGFLVTILLVNILAGVFFAPLAWLNKLIIDKVIANIGNPLWQQALSGLVLLILLRTILEFARDLLSRVSSFLQFYLSRVFDAHLELLLAEQNSSLDVETLENPEFKDKLNKLEREIYGRIWGSMMSFTRIPENLSGLLVAFLILLSFRPWVVVIIVLFVFPQFWIDAKFVKKEYAWSDQISPKYRLRGWLSWYLVRARSYLEMRILRLAPYFLQRIYGLQKEIFESQTAIQKEKESSGLLASLPQNIFYFAFEVYLVILAILQRITVGSMQFYISATNSFRYSFSGLLRNLVDFYENYIYIADLVWFLDLKPKLVSGTHKPPRKIENIEFRNVWFKYPNTQPWVLKEINLKLSSGDRLAVVGENGAGKSTLIKLLCRFYDPQRGEILVNGKNLRDFKRDQWWQKLGVLFQDFETYPFTARESVGYGKIEKVENLPEIQDFARKTAIHPYIASLPLKYENPLARDFEKGVEPSFGQWQRIGLARILLRDSEILVLDEPTSNVDAKAEEEIFGKISQLVKGKNLILISHRFSTVRRAKRIIVLEKGKIIEQGTHQELMKLGGTYAQLFTLQAKAYQ
ncbi:MAG: ABC transporter ATP-binding protein [Patescibacteria group bacterium]